MASVPTKIESLKEKLGMQSVNITIMQGSLKIVLVLQAETICLSEKVMTL
jgi:hypothetical protein